MPWLRQNLLREIHPGATPIKSEGILSVFHKTLVSVQPSPAEELLGGVANRSAIAVVAVSFCSRDCLMRSKLFIVFHWACAGKNKLYAI